VLLEHLAAAARERGIDEFTAEVLPQNTKMIKVFTEAGFDVDRALDDGVVMVSFRIDPTARSLEVMAEREHRAEARAMERLLHPESVLLVGVSSRADSVGGRFLTALERSGYEGTVHLVSRDSLELRGRRAWARISEVPGPVDLAVIALRPEACLDAVEECAAIGVRSVVIPTEGFSESEDGRSLQRELVARIRLHGMRLLGPGSLGVLRTGDSPISLSLAPHMPRQGRAALAGQSSALSAMLLAGTDSRGIGVHEFVGVGNRADVSLNDTLQHWEEIEEVGVIGLALESMGNPRKFTRIARRLTRSTPLIVLRPPGSESHLPPGHDVRPSSLPRRALARCSTPPGSCRPGESTTSWTSSTRSSGRGSRSGRAWGCSRTPPRSARPSAAPRTAPASRSWPTTAASPSPRTRASSSAPSPRWRRWGRWTWSSPGCSTRRARTPTRCCAR
jgi:succinyl-CoA synthetase alpha subunit